MNNSKIALDEISLSLEEQVDNTEIYREKESELIRIIEAINGIKSSAEWSTLKKYIFDSLVESLEKRLRDQSEQLILDAPLIHRLQGQLIWARKYSDLDKLEDNYRIELSKIKKLTQPTER